MCKHCNKLNEELTVLRAFKAKHDEQLKKLVGSVTWKQLHGHLVPNVGWGTSLEQKCSRVLEEP